MLTPNKLNYRLLDLSELLKQQLEQTHPENFLTQLSILQSEHYPVGDIRPPPPYNLTEPHGTPTTVPYPYPPPYLQETSAPHPLQTSAQPYQPPAAVVQGLDSKHLM